MGLAEEVQYWAGRVWHNVKYSALAVVCAVVGIAVFAEAKEFWTSQDIIASVAAGSVLVACVLGYAYSIMMINRYEEDEWEYA